MGSTTYEWILEHDRAGKDPAEWKWPYDIPGWVFTSRQPEVLPEAPIEFVSGDVAAGARGHGQRRQAARTRGSSAAVTSPVSSRTPVSSTRSSSTSRR